MGYLQIFLIPKLTLGILFYVRLGNPKKSTSLIDFNVCHLATDASFLISPL